MLIKQASVKVLTTISLDRPEPSHHNTRNNVCTQPVNWANTQYVLSSSGRQLQHMHNFGQVCIFEHLGGFMYSHQSVKHQ